MNVTILNGNPHADNLQFEEYLKRLHAELEKGGSHVAALTLREMKIRHCTGCWGCWVKTPGECLAKDDSADVCRAVINADWVIFASPMVMGFPSTLLKKTVDKLIPLVHPYIVVEGGEAHHQARYPSYPAFGLLLEREPSGDEEDIAITSTIFSRTARNIKSSLKFTRLTNQPVAEVAHEINPL